MKYAVKPPTVEAMKFDGKNGDEVVKMTKAAMGEDAENMVYALDGESLLIQGRYGGVVLVPVGSYVVVREYGELVSMDAERFEAQYEAV